MSIVFKGKCPCEDFDFTLRYNSPSGDEVTIYCPFCGVEIEATEKDEDEDDDTDYEANDYE